MYKLLKNLWENLVIVLLALGIAWAVFPMLGCAQMYDENGELKTETVEDIKTGEKVASNIVSVVAPEFDWIVTGGTAAFASLATLIGKAFYDKSKKG